MVPPRGIRLRSVGMQPGGLAEEQWRWPPTRSIQVREVSNYRRVSRITYASSKRYGWSLTRSIYFLLGSALRMSRIPNRMKLTTAGQILPFNALHLSNFLFILSRCLE